MPIDLKNYEPALMQGASITSDNDITVVDDLTVSDALTVTGALVSDSTTDTTSTTTGAIQTDGGLGVAKALWVGTTSRLVGAVTADAGVAVTGAISATTTIKSSGPTSGVGYATGAGGTITQDTSKATAFTLSKVTGAITTAADALGAATIVSATWTNTAIAATDVVIINHLSGGTVGAYTFSVAPGAGSAVLTIRNNTAGSLSEALVLSFAVIKGVTS